MFPSGSTRQFVATEVCTEYSQLVSLAIATYKKRANSTAALNLVYRVVPISTTQVAMHSNGGTGNAAIILYEFDVNGDLVTGYTIDGLQYINHSDGYTYISGTTSSYYQDEVYQGMITRDEHLIGFLDLPQISSDIFIERGKQGVMERNLRLGEIDSTGELGIYGSGFFNIRKQ